MGQAKIKVSRKPEKELRKGTARLQSVAIQGNIVSYDEHGRARPEGTGMTERFFLMECDIPIKIVQAIRAKFPKVQFDFVEPPVEKPG